MKRIDSLKRFFIKKMEQVKGIRISASRYAVLAACSDQKGPPDLFALSGSIPLKGF